MVENISIRSSQKYFKISPVKILKSLSRAEYLHHRQRNMNRTTIIKPNSRIQSSHTSYLYVDKHNKYS